MDEQSLIRQKILESLKAASDETQIKKAQDEAKRTAVITAIGRALSGLAGAKSASRGGSPSDMSIYDAIDSRSQGGVQSAEQDRKQKIADILQQNQLRQSLASEDRSAAKDIADKAAQEQEMAFKSRQQSEIERRNKEEERQRALELSARRDEAAQKPVEAPKLTEAQKAFEKVAGEDVANWQNQGGTKAADASIAELEAIRDRLRADKSNQLSGGITDKAVPFLGSVGENLRDLIKPETTAIKQSIGAAALPSMKAMFPGQTSDRELKTFMELSFDPRLAPEENAKKLDAQIQKLKIKRDELDAKSRQLGQTGRISPAASSTGSYPKTLRNGHKTATVSNEAEEQEARQEGWK